MIVSYPLGIPAVFSALWLRRRDIFSILPLRRQRPPQILKIENGRGSSDQNESHTVGEEGDGSGGGGSDGGSDGGAADDSDGGRGCSSGGAGVARGVSRVTIATVRGGGSWRSSASPEGGGERLRWGLGRRTNSNIDFGKSFKEDGGRRVDLALRVDAVMDRKGARRIRKSIYVTYTTYHKNV